MRRESLQQGALLLVLLVLLFPRVFLAGEYAVATSLMGEWAPWNAVFGDDMRPNQNPLPIETVMAFQADYTLVKQQLASGEWPLWNPLQFAGKPLLANYQSTVFYPPRLLHAALPIPIATTLYVLLKLWLCGMTAYGYGRVVGLRKPAARFLSVAWMMGGYAFTWSYWTPTDVAAWFPVVMIGVEFMVRGLYRRGFAALLVGATLMLLAGHPESAFVFGLGAGFYFLMRLAFIRVSAARATRVGAVAIAAWVAALLFCAVQILPFAEYAPLSNNVAFRDHAAEARHAVPLNEWVSFIVPRYFGSNAEENYRGATNSTFNSMMYPGIVVWVGVLGLFGAWRSADRKRAAAWLIASGLAGVLAFDLPIVRTVLGMPLLSSLWQCYFLSFALFGAAVLGAMGIEAWCGAERRLRAMYPAVIAIALCAIAMIPRMAFDFGLVAADGGTSYLQRQLGIAACLAGICLLVLYLSVRRSSRWVPFTFTFLLIIDLGIAGRGLLPATPPDQHFPATEITNQLKQLPDASRVDVVSETDIRPGLMTPYGIEEYWGYDGILPAKTIQFHAHLGDPDKARAISGVTHIVRQTKGGGALSVEPNASLPRAFVAYDWIVEPDWEVAIAYLASEKFDPFKQALLASAVDVQPSPTGPQIESAEIVSYTPDRVAIRTNGAQPGVLVLLDAHYPGWVASLDGEPVELFVANGMFRGVPVSAGAHEVEFSYRPRSFYIGLWISASTLMMALTIAAIRVRFARS